MAPILIESSLSISQSPRSSSVEIFAMAYDANGVDSVSVDLRLDGGELHSLTYNSNENSWKGNFIVPDTIRPGEFRVPILLEDLDGARNIVLGPKLIITNDGPKMSNPSITPSKIISPSLGEMSEENYTITVEAEDADGINAVQIKFYELYPGNEGNTWKLMYDDGSNGDLVAGDGIYSISFKARYLPPGFVEIELRGVDVYGQSTIIKYDVDIESDDTSIGIDPSKGILELLNNPITIFSLLFALVGIVIFVVIILKKNGVNFGNFGDD
jgi:hypothetical protein